MARHGVAVKFLTGAPDSDSLNWSPPGLLLDDFVPAVDRFLHGGSAIAGSPPSQSLSASASPAFPKWRRIQMPDDASQNGTDGWHNCAGGAQSGQAHGLQEQYIDDDDSTVFLERSFAVYETGHPNAGDGQDAGAEDATTSSFLSTTTTTDSFTGTSFASDATSTWSHGPPLPSNLFVTDLRKLPSAAALSALHPQTVTVNLIAGVISVAAARTVTLRASRRTMRIVEVLLGDETRAGFAVSFWLLPADERDALQQRKHDSMTKQRERAADAELAGVLHSLRPRDVVLLSNVALGAFREVVHGQSLSWRVARTATGLRLLGRDGYVPPERLAGAQSALREKVVGVSAWARQYLVGRRSREAPCGGSNSGGGGEDEELPPETQ